MLRDCLGIHAHSVNWVVSTIIVCHLNDSNAQVLWPFREQGDP